MPRVWGGKFQDGKRRGGGQETRSLLSVSLVFRPSCWHASAQFRPTTKEEEKKTGPNGPSRAVRGKVLNSDGSPPLDLPLVDWSYFTKITWLREDLKMHFSAQ